MQTEVKEIGPCKLSIKIEIPQVRVQEKLDEKYRKFVDNTVVPGFRKGQAPRSLLERKYGKDINDEVKLDLISSSYEEVLKEKKLNPIAEPDIDYEKIPFDQAKPLNFEFTVEVSPEIKLEKYTGLEVKKTVAKVTDSEVAKALDDLRNSRAELVPVGTQAAKAGDVIIADQETLADGKVLSKQENTFLKVGEELRMFNKPAPELAKALTGAKAGEVKEIKITVPADYEKAELRNKTAALKITVKEIKQLKLPELTDAWAKELNFEDLGRLKEEIKKGITRDKEKEAERKIEDEIINKILKETDFPLPESMVDRGVDYLIHRRRLQLYQQKTPEDKINEILEGIKKESRTQTERELKVHFIMEHVGKKEKIFVTEDEVTERINEIAASYHKWPQEIKTYYERHNLMGQLRSDLKEEKIRKFLREKAKIAE